MAKELEEGAEAPKKKSKLLIIIIVLVILLGLGGGGYYWFFIKGKAAQTETAEQAPEGDKKSEAKKDEKKSEAKPEAKKEEKKDEKKSEAKKEEKKEGGKKGEKPVTSIQNIITNLADPGGKRYVRISVDFDFASDDDAADFADKYQAQVKDAILTLLWSKTSQDISGVEGMLALRTEIQSRVNQIMGQGKVRQVFITDRVIQ